MNRIYAYIDESGAFGWDLKNPNVSTAMIITAVLVEDKEREDLEIKLEEIRKKHFQKGEMKSSKIGGDHHRRIKILTEFQSLPFSTLVVVIDKEKLKDNKGLHYKSVFYKFCNNIAHKRLRRVFPYLTILADEIGTNEYMQSFITYVENQQTEIMLFGEADFQFSKSQNNVFIQLADLISGSLAYDFDRHKHQVGVPAYRKLLKNKISCIDIYPKHYSSYSFESSLTSDYDKEISELCFNLATAFIHKFEDSNEEIRLCQVKILDFLLFRLMNDDPNAYIPTYLLKKQLVGTSYSDCSTQTFRTKIIGGLRDNDVIISGSSARKGYKIPTKESELYDFINHGTAIIMPMLARLKKCRDIVSLRTKNKLDLFNHTEYSSLQKFFDN